VKLVAESFAWPFRARPSTWALGFVLVLLLPLLFVPLLGYAIAATRSAELDPTAGPPPLRISLPMLWSGGWTVLAIAAVTAPFAILLNPAAHLLNSAAVGFPYVFAALILALPWGLLALLLLPHATAAFASSGNPRDLFDVGASLRGVRHDFVRWNLAAAAIVTGWAVGLASAGVLCVGIVPGVFYAILVSAHAAAALHDKSPRPSPSAR
jgi:hypothetical protein